MCIRDRLSTDQMDQVAFYLGYPNKILVDNSTNFNRIFSQRMMNITQGTAKRVAKLLGLISDARASLDESKESAHVQNVDDVSLDTNRAVENIQRQYRRYINELGSTLNIPVRMISGGIVGTVRITT